MQAQLHGDPVRVGSFVRRWALRGQQLRGRIQGRRGRCVLRPCLGARAAALVPAAPYRLASRRIVSYHPYPRVSSPSIERRPRRVQLPCPLPSTHAPPPPDILQYCAIVISSFDDPDRHRHRYRHRWRSSTIDDPETHFLSLFYFFFSSLFTLRVHRSHLQRRGAVLAFLLLASPFYRCLILCVARLGLGSLVRPGEFF